MLIYQFQTVRASPRSNVCYLRDLNGKNAKQLPDWLSSLVNQSKERLHRSTLLVCSRGKKQSLY